MATVENDINRLINFVGANSIPHVIGIKQGYRGNEQHNDNER